MLETKQHFWIDEYDAKNAGENKCFEQVVQFEVFGFCGRLREFDVHENKYNET